ncbi:MAG: hypothetical protein ABL925_14055 [Methylococcales bacterium]
MNRNDNSSHAKELTTVVYTLTNDPVPNGNAVVAFHQHADGSLVPLAGSPFPTGGAGWKSEFSMPHFGPFDMDQTIVLSADKKRLFTVNGGSDTIAVFDIKEDGALEPVPGSPFASGGKNPVSIGIAGNYIVVVNKNEDPGRDMSKSLPNYTTFTVAENGKLIPVADSTLELETPSRSPTQALIVNERFIYDGDFGNFHLPAREEMWGKSVNDQKPSLIRVMEISKQGKLSILQELTAPVGSFDGDLATNAEGKSNVLMFGLQVHPKEPLIYVAMVTASKLAVYEYDDTGKLTFVSLAPNSGGLICWVTINKAGTRAYTTNNATDSISVYDLTDPRSPKEIQHYELRGHGAPYQMALSSDDKYLYTIKHRTFADTPVGDGGTLNVLHIDEDGKISESKYSPVNVPSRGDLLGRPLGLATR